MNIFKNGFGQLSIEDDNQVIAFENGEEIYIVPEYEGTEIAHEATEMLRRALRG